MSTTFETKLNAVKMALENLTEVKVRHDNILDKINANGNKSYERNLEMEANDVINFEMSLAMDDLRHARDILMDEYCTLVDSYFRLNVKYERKRDAIGTLKNISSASGSPPALLTKLVSDTKTLQTELSKKIDEIMKAIESICDVDPTGDAFNFLHEESERFSMKSGNLSR